MDTIVSQKVSGTDSAEIIQDVSRMLHQLENEWSAYLPDSVPGKINFSAGSEPVGLSGEQFRLVRKSLDFAAGSDGRFDPTIAPLVKLWNISSGEEHIPAPEDISSALDLVGWERVQADDSLHTIYLEQPGMELDFGGCIKGYAVEQALRIYQRSDVSGALISLGGNVAATGKKILPDGSETDFSIGLRDPLGGAADFYAILTMNDQIICTSGGYERFFDLDCRRYHHILDPETGWPAETDLLAVTVIGKDGFLCDCLSTWLFMEGSETVLSHLNEDDYSIIAVGENKKLYVSPSLLPSLTIQPGSGYTLA